MSSTPFPPSLHAVLVCLRCSLAPAVAVALVFLVLLGSVPGRAQQAPVVQFDEQFSDKELVLEERYLPDQTQVTRVRLGNATETGEPGFPILPCILRHVVLPKGAEVLGLEVDPGQVLTRKGHALVEWQQGSQPGGQANREPQPPEYEETPDGPLYYAPESGVPLDPSLQQYPIWPPEVATLGEIRELAGYQVVTIKIFPVRWAPAAGDISIATSVSIGISYSGGALPDPKRDDYISHAELEELRGMAVNGLDLPELPFPPLPEELDAWYLIITDNYRWFDKVRGLSLAGDMVEEFERLAEWKTQKGVLGAVVTVTDILDGRYGNFDPPGTRDLQEVLRNFLKHARREFNTQWVLLGGDVAVVPARSVVAHTGNGTHFIELDSMAQPEENRCYWDLAGQRIRIHQSGYINAGMVIIGRRTGKPFSRVVDPSATNPGWCYVTDDTYATPTTTKTDYIRLAGPSPDIGFTHFYAARGVNTIPTDLYYASVDSPLYDQPGKHDWDLNDNGYYGQYVAANSIDGVDYWADLAVGRAPVQSGDEARAFVDKVIAYEQHDGLPASFGRSLLIGAANWGGGPSVTAGISSPPDEGRYWSAVASTTSELHFKGPPDTRAAFDLVAYNGPGDHWIVPYDKDAGPANLGYYFCRDETYSTVSEIYLDFFGLGGSYIPIPTQYVKVRGPSGEVRPAKFFFDSVEPDLAVVEKEQVKDLFALRFPSINARTRLYEDLEDTPGYPDPDLFELSRTAMQAELNSGYNIISLSGHGWPGGCCAVSRDYVSDLTNGFKGGVVYAESCSTSSFQEEDAVSETFLKSPGGGAVAYVGNSAYSWVGLGDDLERVFWERLRSDRHVGRLHNSKASLTGNDYHRWAQFALNLMGDPEMSIWTGSPDRLQVEHPTCVAKGEPFDVTVTTPAGAPVVFARVCVTGPRGIFELHYTGVSGKTTFSTDANELGDELVVTVSKRDWIPYQGDVLISGACGLRFIRADINSDAILDLSDSVALLGYLFLGAKAPVCDDAADVNDDGLLDISDAIRLLSYLFLGDNLPPGTTPGKPQSDDTQDALGCTVGV